MTLAMMKVSVTAPHITTSNRSSLRPRYLQKPIRLSSAAAAYKCFRKLEGIPEVQRSRGSRATDAEGAVQIARIEWRPKVGPRSPPVALTGPDQAACHPPQY